MTAPSHRLSILSAEEIEDLYSPPRFTDNERAVYFVLSEEEQAFVTSRRGAIGVYFIVLLGYFKAKRQFFDLDTELVHADVAYLVARYFPDIRERLVQLPSRPTLAALQDKILELHKFRRWHSDVKPAVLKRLAQLAIRSTHPRYLVREALQHFERESIVLPPYSVLQDCVGAVVSAERNRLTFLLKKALTRSAKEHLKALLEADGSMYRISVLKQDLNDFSYTALKEEVSRRQAFQPLHAFAAKFIAGVGISQESSKYYASLVAYYTVYKLQRMEPLVARLYLLCYAYHRYREINDHLVEAFTVRVENYARAARQASDDAMQQALIEGSQSLKAAGEILNLFVDISLPDSASFGAIKTKAYTYLSPERIPVVADYMRNIAFDKTGFQWKYYTSLSLTIKKNLRHLFVELDFAGRVEDAPLMEAVAFLQEHLRQGRSPRQIDVREFPTTIVAKRLRRYIFIKDEDSSKRRLDVDRYEFLVYRLLCDAIAGGNIYVGESNEYRRFEDDLISDERWRQKDSILRDLAAPMLRAPIQITLDGLRTELEELYVRVNDRIVDRSNAHIKLRGQEKRRWNLIYPSAQDSDENPFYKQLPIAGIADLFWFAAPRTGYLKAFTHVIERFVKQAPDPREILACATAMGTNMGLLKMAEVSGISYSKLLNTARSFFRSETIRAANDHVANATATLSAFPLFNIRNEVHSSSDGQRFETQVHTHKSRYSPKYFGLKKGVSVCTVVANHVPINGTVIGAHEHESHFVFDLLFNNTTDIRPEWHSTDTHGTNQINFLALACYGYQFAPRYRDVQSKAEKIVGFHVPSHYGKALVKPARKINESLIISEWPNIQRILASLGQKEVTQSTIVRKLSSYDRQNRTKKAMWELDSIYRTIYLLKFIDDVELRQSVQKALNRGEAYHRFRRAIAFVNSGKFRVQTEEQQQLWNDCSRLIANIIIFYNMSLLSRIYDQMVATGDLAGIELLKGVAPVAWQHVNLFGNLEFSERDAHVDLDALAALFADPAKWLQTAMEAAETGFD
ncbi:Tn3 family transposase [Rhodanobacter sp. MP1X3]|uniref:Tn3 family transposase n=1 Tax=Rhodanobacter sp. MP1X3 TaxID=2723086 RepID=UPI001619409E|nr:Tn3 family transposase [Rhodanobacter sp. MP1X3]MBB6244447.1 TnpA family transposase [Rhodanobacter sp. MP1X3]